jgi:regulatory protein YycH of two-component signal transduction system YycFG
MLITKLQSQNVYQSKSKCLEYLQPAHSGYETIVMILSDQIPLDVFFVYMSETDDHLPASVVDRVLKSVTDLLEFS